MFGTMLNVRTTGAKTIRTTLMIDAARIVMPKAMGPISAMQATRPMIEMVSLCQASPPIQFTHHSVT